MDINFRLQRVYEDGSRIIYNRLHYRPSGYGENERRYFEYDTKKGESTGKEFRSITQVKKYIKTL